MSYAVSALDSHVGFWLRFVSNHVSHRFARHIEACGVTVSEWVALRELYSRDLSTPTTLMNALGMTKGAVSKIVDRLETKELVMRLSDPEDARAQSVKLTRAGRALVPRLAAIADENDLHLFQPLSTSERRSLVRTLKKLVHAHGLSEVPTS